MLTWLMWWLRKYSHGGHKLRRNLQSDGSDSNLYPNTVSQSGGGWQQVSLLCPPSSTFY